jgi:hypothetical protein
LRASRRGRASSSCGTAPYDPSSSPCSPLSSRMSPTPRMRPRWLYASWTQLHGFGPFVAVRCDDQRHRMAPRSGAKTGCREPKAPGIGGLEASCQRRDSNPRHADYDSGRLWRGHRESGVYWTRRWSQPHPRRGHACRSPLGGPGWVIAMFFDDHGYPHFHARHAAGEAKVRIDTSR